MLDADAKSFRERPLAASYTYVWPDALMIDCREGGLIVNVACQVAETAPHPLKVIEQPH